MPLSRPFDGFVEYAKRVSPTCLAHVERNRYSVPASFANRPVSVRVYPERIIIAAEGQIVGHLCSWFELGHGSLGQRLSSRCPCVTQKAKISLTFNHGIRGWRPGEDLNL
jgi:hypothetical protein